MICITESGMGTSEAASSSASLPSLFLRSARARLCIFLLNSAWIFDLFCWGSTFSAAFTTCCVASRLCGRLSQTSTALRASAAKAAWQRLDGLLKTSRERHAASSWQACTLNCLCASACPNWSW
eukprot:CAMPEP_0202389766 /NCGR_PEP_ID=MMETSP1127-20130417/84990_1 /ASSEMBLY_ACC=CAM_ASM_000462 /TAXON_ID=3047 /ORGANISM="Dunaliella tertiolecta, Strain CCMP1320" /LENGTH=123 /DNA_ID=CAMNT_0048991651 /DNA_START=1243 /DNA_END=1611 /DNA_ORIENTATION=-